MIYKYEDFLEKLSELHPEVEMKSLDIIAKKGLLGINRIMRLGQELIINNFYADENQKDWIKFFINMDPIEQNKHATRNYYRKLRKKELDGTK